MLWNCSLHYTGSSIDDGGSGPLGPEAFFTLLRAPIVILWGAHLLFFGPQV